MVDPEIFPNFFRFGGNGIKSENIFQHATLESWFSTNLPQYYIDETNRIMERRGLKNDYTLVPRTIVYRDDKTITVKKHQTYIKYIWSEGCGIDRFVIVKDLKLNRNGLLGVFSEEIINKECSGSYIEITAPLTPNKRYEIGNYIIEHEASLSERLFQHGGFGSATPTYFNTILSIKDREKNKPQILLKLPYILELRNIIISDLCCVSIIILDVVEYNCQYRLIYVSPSHDDSLFEFVGFSQECDCP